MSGRDLSDVLLLIPCCASKDGNGPAPVIVSPLLNSQLSVSAWNLLAEGRREVMDEHCHAFDFNRDVRAAMVWYTGYLYQVAGFRNALDQAFERGMRCLIVSAGYGLLRPDDPIHWYDIQMADVLRIWRKRLPKVVADYVRLNGVSRVFASMSKGYCKALTDLQAKELRADLLWHIPTHPRGSPGGAVKVVSEAVGRSVVDLVAAGFHPDRRWSTQPVC